MHVPAPCPLTSAVVLSAVFASTCATERLLDVHVIFSGRAFSGWKLTLSLSFWPAPSFNSFLSSAMPVIPGISCFTVYVNVAVSLLLNPLFMATALIVISLRTVTGSL